MAELANVATGVPLKVTLPASAINTPFKVAVPLKVALVLPSKTLLLAIKPVMVRLTAEISAVKPVGCVSV